MKRLFALLILMLVAFSGCNSSTGNDDKNSGDTGNNSAGNGGTFKVFGMAKLNSVEGAGISGATVKLAGANTNLSVNTDASGNFSFSNIANGTYAVIITKANYTFVPLEVPVTVSGKDVVVQTFVGTTSGGVPGGNTGSAGSHTFFPLKLGAAWTYDSQDSEDSSYNYTYTDKVVGTIALGGKTYWMYETTYPGESVSYSDTTLFRVENNVLYGFWSMEDMLMKAASKAAKLASVTKALVSTFGSEMTLLKFGQSAGHAWTIYDSGVYAGSSLKVTGKYIGTESVTVPAGSFSNCAKFEVAIVMTGKDPSTNITVTSTDTSTQWLAAGVGIVKSVGVSKSGSGQDASMYTSTDVLKSYIIP
ncbi:MAG: carboxypeptidase-like regulatory domain-containing protein [Candidatus Latescibacterota bacterium]